MQAVLTPQLTYLSNLLTPHGYELDSSQERPFFWKAIQQNDLRSPYAFSLVLVTLFAHTVVVEGLNEPRLKRAIRAGIITIESEADVDALKELIFETSLDLLHKLEHVIPFLEQQLAIIETQAIATDEYKRALANIKLLIDAAESLND